MPPSLPLREIKKDSLFKPPRFSSLSPIVPSHPSFIIYRSLTIRLSLPIPPYGLLDMAHALNVSESKATQLWWL